MFPYHFPDARPVPRAKPAGDHGSDGHVRQRAQDWERGATGPGRPRETNEQPPIAHNGRVVARDVPHEDVPHEQDTDGDDPRNGRPALAIATVFGVLVVILIAASIYVATRGENLAPPGVGVAGTGRLPDNRWLRAAQQAAVVDRLEEILAIQDQALGSRDATLLPQVFADSCPCLRAGRQRITALRRDALWWVGYRSALERARPVPGPGGAWTVSAIWRAAPVRVETEQHDLLRIIPGDSRAWRFWLAPAPGGGPLLLQRAELA